MILILKLNDKCLPYQEKYSQVPIKQAGRVGWEKNSLTRDCSGKFANGLNIQISIVQELYERPG